MKSLLHWRHSWRYEINQAYRTCNKCGRAEYAFNGKWHLDELNQHGKEVMSRMKALLIATLLFAGAAMTLQAEPRNVAGPNPDPVYGRTLRPVPNPGYPPVPTAKK